MVKKKCVVALGLPEEILTELNQHYEVAAWSNDEAMPEITLQESLRDASGLLCALSTPITESIIANALELKVISTISVGVDHIDIAPRPVLVSRSATPLVCWWIALQIWRSD